MNRIARLLLFGLILLGACDLVEPTTEQTTVTKWQGGDSPQYRISNHVGRFTKKVRSSEISTYAEDGQELCRISIRIGSRGYNCSIQIIKESPSYPCGTGTEIRACADCGFLTNEDEDQIRKRLLCYGLVSPAIDRYFESLK
jgi:hypothetical protein